MDWIGLDSIHFGLDWIRFSLLSLHRVQVQRQRNGLMAMHVESRMVQGELETAEQLFSTQSELADDLGNSCEEGWDGVGGIVFFHQMG